MTDLLHALMDGWNLVRPWLGGLLILFGSFFAIIGTVGVLRFPDVYTRLHAASVTDTAAATLMLVGMAILSPGWLIAFKLGAIWVFLFLTGPTATHALANAAHTAGLPAMVGRMAQGDDEVEDGA